MALLDHLFKRDAPPDSARQLGRNDPCWCGSGKKYKRCHFAHDREYFARTLAAACKGPT